MANSLLEQGNVSRMLMFIDKASRGTSIKIGCIGGSITAGSAASDTGSRYINVLQRCLERLFPKSSFFVINAGVPATNSRFGCSRLKDDLLNNLPDLIIIEFAVNDNSNDSVLTTQCMEGLVRQCLRLDSVPVIMLCTMNIKTDSATQHLHANIGRYYSLPIISFRNAIAPLIANGIITWDSIANDDVHPNDKGHLMIANLLYSFIKTIYLQKDTANSVPFAFPQPYSTDLYEFAGIHRSIAGDPIIITNTGWNKAEKEFGRIGYSATGSGDSLQIECSLDEITIGYLYREDLNGQLQIKLDGQVIGTISNHFANDWGGGCMLLSQVYKQSSGAKHTITLTNMSNNLFEISYILYAQ